MSAVGTVDSAYAERPLVGAPQQGTARECDLRKEE